MAGGWATTIKIGKVGKEISFSLQDDVDMINDFKAKNANAQAESQNTVKETFTVIHRRFQRDYSIRFGELSKELAWKLDSLNGLRAQHIAFIFADGWKVHSEEYVTEDGLGITLKSTSHLLLDKAYNAAALAAVMRITGVWDSYDPGGAQILGGVPWTYNRATGVFTFTTPRTIGTSVFVNWEYDGALVKMKDGVSCDYSGTNDSSGAPRWNASINFKGV